jgi:DHA1 family tetracycline resistance protein-like MFS transporter
MFPLFLTVFIDLLGFGIAVPLLPFYAQKFGASPELVTLVIATYSLAQFISLPYWGRVSDRVGRRPVLLLTLAGATASWILTAYVDSLWMLFAARAFAGAMAGNAAVAQAYVADTTTPENRARGHGIIGAAFGLGFLLGPAFGGLLAGNSDAPDFQLPFFAAAALSAVALLFAALRLPESLSPEARAAARATPRQSRLTQLADAVTRRRLGILVALMFLTPFVFSGVETTFALWSQAELGWGPRENGYAYSFMGLVAVLVQGGSIGPLTRMLGERRLLLLGPVLIGVGMVGLPLAGEDLGLLAAALFLIVAGVCVTTPSLTSLISQRAGEHERGALLGVAQASGGLARIVGPAWGGFAFAALGREWPYFTGALLMVAAFALALAVRPPRG